MMPWMWMRRAKRWTMVKPPIAKDDARTPLEEMLMSYGDLAGTDLNHAIRDPTMKGNSCQRERKPPNPQASR